MATMQAPTRELTALTPFRNEPLTDFSREDNARKMRAAIEKVRTQLGREYDLVIGGRRVKTNDKIKSINPAKPSEVVGIFQKAGTEHVEPAMQAALTAFKNAIGDLRQLQDLTAQHEGIAPGEATQAPDIWGKQAAKGAGGG